MKRLTWIALLPLAACSYAEPASRPASAPASRPFESPVVERDEGGRYESYGAPIRGEPIEQVTVSRLLDDLDAYVGRTVRIESRVHSTCKKKGCWMWVGDDGGRRVFVRFKDYGFFVPKEGAEGRRVVFDGEVSRKELSVEEARHYAEDAGDDEAARKISEPIQIPFVMATGVKMYLKP